MDAKTLLEFCKLSKGESKEAKKALKELSLSSREPHSLVK
jgi:hypothetical protein